MNLLPENLEECDLCHDLYPIRFVKIQEGGQILCRKCAEGDLSHPDKSDHPRLDRERKAS